MTDAQLRKRQEWLSRLKFMSMNKLIQYQYKLEVLLNAYYVHSEDKKLYRHDLNEVNKYIHRLDNFFVPDPKFLHNMGILQCSH